MHKCEVCGKSYKFISYPRVGPAPGFRYVRDCDCETEFDKKLSEEFKKLEELYHGSASTPIEELG